ncbi:TIGR03089 family protein [Nocardioides donggukensis]|uniref:TIGR03089 family protein n=1 Tax=Nocardioides donggukensis TaxID=2774019 RepID=A0A927PZ98_9ACTN|nr:TIGR03089 family protein [Nocardioides donggukensis]MBD8868725.1 TIGR03089 family protein [Nocardioides donggukensis]
MAETFPALLTELLRSDPGRPLVTFYDDATGERVELSVTTYANWVAKTASLLVEETDLERGMRLLVDLPTHWLGPVFLGAAWSVGLTVVWEGPADAVVCGPEGLEARVADSEGHQTGAPVVACALRPLGVRFADPVPPGVLDFGIEVWSQPDSFVAWDPPTGDDEAVPGIGQRTALASTGGEVADLLTPGGRLLTAANPASPTGLATFLAPLTRSGGTVWVANPDPTRWEQRYAEERATAQWCGPESQPTRS